MRLTPEEIAEQQKNEENTKKKYITPVIQERWGKRILTISLWNITLRMAE